MGEKIIVLNKVARESLTEKMSFEQRLVEGQKEQIMWIYVSKVLQEEGINIEGLIGDYRNLTLTLKEIGSHWRALRKGMTRSDLYCHTTLDAMKRIGYRSERNCQVLDIF